MKRKVVYTGLATIIFSGVLTSVSNVQAIAISSSSATQASSSSSATQASSSSSATQASSSSSATQASSSSSATQASSSSSATQASSSSSVTQASSSENKKNDDEDTGLIYNPNFSDSLFVNPGNPEDIKIPFPVHYKFNKYNRYGTKLNDIFPQFEQAHAFGEDSSSLLLNNGANNSIGGINTKQTIALDQDFSMSGTIYVEPWGLGTHDSGDGFSIGFHGDKKSAHGETGGNIGIRGIKDGYFFLIDLYKNEGDLPAPFINKSITDHNGEPISQGMTEMYQTNSKGVRKEGPKAVFGDFYKKKYNWFTPFQYEFSYDKDSRNLKFSLKNYKGEEQTTDNTNQFHIPEETTGLNFYSAGVTGGKLSNYKLHIENAVFSEYQTNTPGIDNFRCIDNNYHFKLINPNAKENNNQPKYYPNDTKATYIIDDNKPVETILNDNSELVVPKLKEGKHKIKISLQTLYNHKKDYAAYSDYTEYLFTDGELSLSSVPSNIDFGKKVKLSSESLHLKGKNIGSLLVTDTRDNSHKNNWELLLKEKTALINKSGVRMSYKNRDNQLIDINGNNQPIEHNLINRPEEDNISDGWEDSEHGLFLDVPASAQKIGKYSGILTWTLQDTPLTK